MKVFIRLCTCSNVGGNQEGCEPIKSITHFPILEPILAESHLLSAGPELVSAWISP